ncbi:MAG: hypothetical protein K2J72_07895 [Oscillospiraceae bacterium]|nr:hypothetical protein [Oscillospiraceae bacterium]
MSTENLKSKLNSKVKDISNEERITMQETTITKNDTNYAALKNNALDIIKNNLKNQPLSLQLFDIIKSPSGGSTSFTIPTLSGETMEKSITGIILDYTTPRAYWDTPDPVEGTPSVCFSSDSLVSHDGKACGTCPFNDFGSKDGETNAKACKESVVLFLLRPDNIMPILVRVPVSSKMLFQRYMTRLIGKMIPVSGVVTKITLEKTTNKTGQPYATYNFEAVETLSTEEAENARAFGKKFMELVNASDVNRELQKAG